MATRSTGGATLELQAEGLANFEAKMKDMQVKGGGATLNALTKFLYQIKTLAQLKLTSDGHIITSRLKNSIYVLRPPKSTIAADPTAYKDNDGNSFDALFHADLDMREGAVGTNVVYANKIEYENDSFLYYAMKHADTKGMARDIAKELGILKL